MGPFCRNLEIIVILKFGVDKVKLSKLTIRNFKGIKELSIDIENISVIIGPNNCGKSTILQALKVFGTAQKLEKKHFYKHDLSYPISFHATFTNITLEEAELHGIRASMHMETNTFIVRAVYNSEGEVKRAAKISGECTHDLEDEGWDGKLGGGKNGSNFLSVFPEVIYIPAVKDANDEIKSASENMKTLTKLYKEIIHSLDEYTEAETKTRLLQDKINQHNNPKIRFFESEVQSFLSEVTSTTINFKVDVKPIDEIVSTSVSPFFNYNGIETDIENQGSGVQRTFILSILKGFRKYKSQYSSDPKEHASSNRPLIFAIEEPELYLHPQIAKVFKDTLYSLADDDLFQIVASSHSPNFIDLSKPNRTLVRMSLDFEKNVQINQVSSDIYGLPEDEVDRFQALLRFNPHVNEVFFADRAILVEGDTEVVAFKLIGEKLVSKKTVPAETFNRTTVINCAGKPTMYVVLNILNNFGIPYTVIHDFDITEINKKNERRTPAALKSVITINHKLEVLAQKRGNRKYVFQHTFEAEMPEDYEKGTSKSFAAYEYIKDKELSQLPENLIKIIGSAFDVALEEPLDHSVENLINLIRRNDWDELNTAIEEWQVPMMEEYVKTLWVPLMVAPTREDFPN
jgi:putative ATP-dependent endonuclease of OLD family